MKPFRRSPTGLSWPANFIVCASVLLLTLVLIPESVLSQGGHDHHGGGAAQPGSEYRVDEKPMEHHHHDDGGGEGDLFRTRGAHDDLGASKPEMVKDEGLLARGRNIYLHMCVFCHG